MNKLHYFVLWLCFITIVGKVIFINFCLHAFAIVVIDIIFLTLSTNALHFFLQSVDDVNVYVFCVFSLEYVSKSNVSV